MRSQSGTSLALGYTGQLTDPSIGFVDLRARQLNPTLGRFLSADSVQPNAPGSQGYNLYAYVANNPTSWVDLSGHMPAETAELLGLVGAEGLLELLAAPELGGLVLAGVFVVVVIWAVVAILSCVLDAACLDRLQQQGHTVKQYGSAAAAGAWTLGVTIFAQSPGCCGRYFPWNIIPLQRYGPRRARSHQAMNAMPPSRIEWLSDLIRLEITLWNRIDARLRAEHGLPLAYFWPLYVVGRSSDERLRVGEIAESLGLTVGGTSKIVDRIERAGLLRREPDPDDRRASRVVLADAGRRALIAASETYETEMATALDSALSAEQQDCFHNLVRRLLDVTGFGEPS